MKPIDSETVRRILDTADIVEVVSDFVQLKRAGANYKGLCPFHNERTPSFSVNKARNYCKCFSCGKGGSPVGFIMEHEHYTFNEALRYLARKYNIPIVERDVTPEERQQDNDRQSMLAINDFALAHFEHNLTETDDGRNIGLAYLRDRGINDAMIKRFHLGYALDRNNSLSREALAKGYSEKYLVETGLCSKREDGSLFERFRGRVIFPVHSMSGRVVAFGGRILQTSSKHVGKYINSPESLIYKKSDELYGLYQAKSAISKTNKCILVEGYMDVISMHQVGVENVVASSGTSLTEGQIKLISRFTRNVTVIYDSDKAGIKASLRGIDMLLRADLDIKVVSLPDGDDPDSFAQSHSATEVEEYLTAHEEDFIRFKTRILLADCADDPIKRAQVINDVLQSIAVIPSEIKRQVYIDECARTLAIDSTMLARQVAVLRGKSLEADARERQKHQAAESLNTTTPLTEPTGGAASTPGETVATIEKAVNLLEPYEREIVRYVMRYGFFDFCVTTSDDGTTTEPCNVVDFVATELQRDSIAMTVPSYAHVLEIVAKIAGEQWLTDKANALQAAEQRRKEEFEKGLDVIRAEAVDTYDIQNREKALTERCDKEYNDAVADYTADYVQRQLMSWPDDDIRHLAEQLTTDRHQLSKVHSKYSHVETERERLADLVPRAIYELKSAIIEQEMKQINEQLRSCGADDTETVTELMQRLTAFQAVRNDLARYLGDRIITPIRKG